MVSMYWKPLFKLSLQILQLDNAGNAEADFVSSNPGGFILPHYGFHVLEISFQASFTYIFSEGKEGL